VLSHLRETFHPAIRRGQYSPCSSYLRRSDIRDESRSRRGAVFGIRPAVSLAKGVPSRSTTACLSVLERWHTHCGTPYCRRIPTNVSSHSQATIPPCTAARTSEVVETGQSEQELRVFLVKDSASLRERLVEMIEADGEHHVVGEAATYETRWKGSSRLSLMLASSTSSCSTAIVSRHSGGQTTAAGPGRNRHEQLHNGQH
jgi:hypothetical protein